MYTEVTCYYWCWYSMLDDLIIIIPVDSLSISGGAVAQWSKHLQLKQEVLGSISGGCPGFFSLLAGLLMLMG